MNKLNQRMLTKPEQFAELIIINGQVQGVGFRPFVYRLAKAQQILGWVKNEVGHVSILAQGSAEALARFKKALIDEAPPLAKPSFQRINKTDIHPLHDFAILL